MESFGMESFGMESLATTILADELSVELDADDGMVAIESMLVVALIEFTMFVSLSLRFTTVG